MIGMEEGLLPHARSLAERTTTALEEERRLCYVGMTRAKKHLYLSLASDRNIYAKTNWQYSGQHSRFLSELPRKLVKFERNY